MKRAVLVVGRLVAIGFIPLILIAGAARAEHEVYYRYTVLGYVKDGKGQPLPRLGVELTRDRTGFSYLGETDEAGLYIVVARLGDESVGETLTLRIGQARTRVNVRFEARNHDDERGTRIDLAGARWTERTSWFRSTLARVLEAGSR